MDCLRELLGKMAFPLPNLQRQITASHRDKKLGYWKKTVHHAVETDRQTDRQVGRQIGRQAGSRRGSRRAMLCTYAPSTSLEKKIAAYTSYQSIQAMLAQGDIGCIIEKEF